MALQRIFLDKQYRDSLERLAIESGWITHDIDGQGMPLPPGRNSLRRKVLLIATLFGHVDSDWSYCDLSRLVDAGIVSEDAKMVVHALVPRRRDSNEDKQLLHYCQRTARGLMRSFRSRIVDRHMRDRPEMYDGSSGDFGTRAELLAEFEWVLDHLDGVSRAGKPWFDTYCHDLSLVPDQA